MRNIIGGLFFWRITMYTDEGLINLAEALVRQARYDYDSMIADGYDIDARVIAEQDTRGIVGYIVAWVCNDKDYLFNEVVGRTVF